MLQTPFSKSSHFEMTGKTKKNYLRPDLAKILFIKSLII